MNNKKVLSAAILFILAKSAFGIEVEPNNISNNATTLELGGVENVGQLSNGNDVDFYTIDAAKEISLTFACNSRAVANNNKNYGWYLTIHDDEGVLQSSYQVEPEECVTGTTTAKGPYNFRIPKLEESNRKYYLSVVGDCGTTPPRLPIFNFDTKTAIISLNGVDKPATNREITNANNSLNTLEDIRDSFEVSRQQTSQTDVQSINQRITQARERITTNGNDAARRVIVSELQTIETAVAVNTYISVANTIISNSESKAKVNSVRVTADTLNSVFRSIVIPNTMTVTTAVDAIINAPTEITQEQVNNLRNAIDQINNVNVSIENLNSIAENLNVTISTIQNVCSAGNTANYTITDNSNTATAPYKSIKEKAIVLGKENSGQNGFVSDVDFFELAGSETDVVPLKFSCAKNSAKGKEQGWVLSAWKPNDSDALDKPEFVYQVAPADCNAPEVYSIQLPSFAKNYYIGVQSACGLPPRDTSTILQSSYFYSNSTSLDYLCDANTANFTLKRDLKIAIPLVVDVPKTGAMSSRSDYDLFVVENDEVNDYTIGLSCSETIATTANKSIWKLSVYDDSDKLIPNYPQEIKATDCSKTEKIIELSKNVIRSYITLEPILPLDTSKYTIKKSLKKVETTIVIEPEKLGSTDGASVLLSAIEKGKIVKTTDMFNYYVDGSSLKETSLSFSCKTPEILFGNNWKVSVYQSDRTLKDTHIINSSDCLPNKTTGESAYTITLPKEATRFYLQVKSTCDDANCKVDQSEFEIVRKTEIVPTVTDSTPPIENIAFKPFANIDTTKIAVLDKLFKKRIKKADEIHFYSVASSLENDMLIDFSCPKNTGTTAWTVGIWEYDADNAQNSGWLYEKYTILPSACISKTVQLTVPSNSSSHLISVQSSCLTTPVNSESTLDETKNCNVNTSNYTLERGLITTETNNTPIVTTPVVPDPIVAKLASAKKITTVQKNQLKFLTDLHAYYVDTGVETATNFEFACPTSNRFTNDWTLLIYDSAKKLQSTQIINGSDCGMGQIGDSGPFKFSSLKNSTRSYFVVKPACKTGDSVCVVDSSQYQIKRIIPAATTSSTSTITAPCFYSSCTTPVTDAPVFGAK